MKTIYNIPQFHNDGKGGNTSPERKSTSSSYPLIAPFVKLIDFNVFLMTSDTKTIGDFLLDLRVPDGEEGGESGDDGLEELRLDDILGDIGGGDLFINNISFSKCCNRFCDKSFGDIVGEAAEDLEEEGGCLLEELFSRFDDLVVGEQSLASLALVKLVTG